MQSVEEHLGTVLAGIGTLEPIELTLLDAQGLQLAEDVVSAVSLPGFDSAGVDGYALRSADTRDATVDHPAVLSVVGDVEVGAKTVSGIGPDSALRIMNGAPLPAGIDAVIPIAETDGGVARVALPRPARAGENVRKIGEDLLVGHAALSRGAALGPQQIALLAAIGRDRVTVRPRPRVVVISTGSELVDVAKKPSLGEVTDSNSFMIAAAARDAGADAYRAGIVIDDHSIITEVLENQLLRADIVVTTGGVSSQTFDVVRQTLTQMGTVEFAQVAMQPGMTQGFGYIGKGMPIFCLPGDPVSALVSFEIFVRPAIRHLLGKRTIQRTSVQAMALERVESPPGIREYRRGVLHREADGAYSVAFVGGPGAHLIASMAASNCLVVIDESQTEVVTGQRVTVIPLLLSHR